MPASIPKKVKVGPYTYTVEIHAALDDAEVNLRGVSDTDQHYIRLNPKNPPGLMRSTLLHEVLHAVAVSGAAIGTNERLPQEAWISRIEASLLAVLRDNPAVIAYLTGS